MPEQTIAFTDEDWARLHQLSTSDNANERALASSLAKKLYPNERQAFFDWQQQANAGKGELTRVDSPDLYLMMGAPAARALMGGPGAGAAAAAGSVAGRIGSRVAAAGAAAAPYVKFQAIKGILDHFGVSPVISEPLAYFASGYKSGGAKGVAPAMEEAAPAATAGASGPALPRPYNATSTGFFSAPGASGGAQAAPVGPSAPLAVLQKSMPPLTAAESKQLLDWRAAGVPDAQIRARLLPTRALQATNPFANLPTNVEAAQAVTTRNQTGQWP
jgi:hypothetical protein